VKKSITDVVARVTTAGGADFVPVDQGVATFDNDGTLWTEQPVYFQVAFAFMRPLGKVTPLRRASESPAGRAVANRPAASADSSPASR
jgi:hypothetical protein